MLGYSVANFFQRLIFLVHNVIHAVVAAKLIGHITANKIGFGDLDFARKSGCSLAIFHASTMPAALPPILPSPMRRL